MQKKVKQTHNILSKNMSQKTKVLKIFSKVFPRLAEVSKVYEGKKGVHPEYNLIHIYHMDV